MNVSQILNHCTQNAINDFQRETSLPSIPSFSQSFDNMLGNDGVQLGSITELLGLPGSGKTQLWFVFIHVFSYAR